jgi:hypothetical protein
MKIIPWPYTEEALLELITKTIEDWAKEEFESNPESTLNYEERVQENWNLILNQLEDCAKKSIHASQWEIMTRQPTS